MPGIGEIGVRSDGFVEAGERRSVVAAAREHGREAVERPGIGGLQLQRALEKLPGAGEAVGVFGVEVAQDDEAPRIVGREAEGVDEGVLGLLGAAQLHEAHGEIAMGGGERGIEREDALVEFDGAGEIALARAFAGAFVELCRLVRLRGSGGRQRNVRDAIALASVPLGLAELRDERLLGHGAIRRIAGQKGEVRQGNREGQHENRESRRGTARTANFNPRPRWF